MYIVVRFWICSRSSEDDIIAENTQEDDECKTGVHSPKVGYHMNITIKYMDKANLFLLVNLLL